MYLGEELDNELCTEFKITDEGVVVTEVAEYHYVMHKEDPVLIRYEDIIGISRKQQDLEIYYFNRMDNGSVLYGLVRAEYYFTSDTPADYDKLVKNINKVSKKYLFIINPVSGSGRGLYVFNNQIAHILDAGFHTYNVVCPSSKAVMKNYLVSHKSTLDKFAALVILGGDGTVFDVAQVVKEHSIKVPLFVIPTGSGNGLARSLFGNVPYIPKTTDYVHKLLNGSIHKLDTAECVGYMNDELVSSSYSILGQAWGLPSAVDIKSEYIRWLGGFRFTIQTLVELYRMETYNGTLKYLPYSDNTLTVVRKARASGLDYENLNGWVTIDGDFKMVWACQIPYMSSDTKVAPDVSLCDDQLHLVIIRDNFKNISRYELLTMFLGLEAGKHIESDKIDIIPAIAYTLEVSEDSKNIITVDGEHVKCNKLSVCIDEPINVIY